MDPNILMLSAANAYQFSHAGVTPQFQLNGANELPTQDARFEGGGPQVPELHVQNLRQ